MVEADIENRVVRWATRQGWLHLKINVIGNRGWPDQLFISPTGTHVWIEFKAPGKKPRPLQRHRLRKLQKQHVYATWFDDADKAISYLEVCDAF